METLLESFINKSTKEIIINILIEKQPQSLKEIYSKFKKESKKNVSYQAIHKAIKELENEKIINKKLKEYTINQFWIDNLFEKINKIKNNNLVTDPKKTYFFETYSDFAKFIINQAYTIPNNNKPCVCVMKYSWNPLGLDKTDLFKMSKFLKERNYYDLTLNQTPLDYAFAKTLEKLGKHVKVGSKIRFNNDLIIQGNTLIEIYFDNKLKNIIKNIFKKNKQLDELAIQEIITKIVTPKHNIQIILYEDEQKADNLRKKILKEF
jgi:hypothetical protein